MTKQTVTVHAKPTGRGEMARVVTTVESQDDSGKWVQLDQRTQIAEGRNAMLDFELQDGQRLIVETKTIQRVVMDPNQKAAILAPVSDEDGKATVEANEAARLRNAERQKERAAHVDKRMDRLMADSKGSPGPGEVDKLQEQILKEQREQAKKDAQEDRKAEEQAEKDARKADQEADKGPASRPLTQAGGSSPNTAGKVESKGASAEAKIGAQASGTPAPMSGTSADGAKDSKQVK